MGYEANVLKVLIASPKDVAEERKIIRDVLSDWNDINSEDKKKVLLPVDWETHSHPEMGRRPQEIINRQIVENSDILVAVFWTRIGTPTGESDSGTIEEIEQFVRDGKKVMIYFSTAPVKMESVDQEQYELLQKFKADAMKKGLVETYDSTADFRKKFFGQISHHLIDENSGATDTLTIRDLFLHASEEMSKDEMELLVAASQDKAGTILAFKTFAGLSINTNGRDFCVEGNAREEARWQAAIDGLLSKGFIESIGYKNEIFTVTHAGYQAADSLG